jgi:PilZ domain
MLYGDGVDVWCLGCLEFFVMLARTPESRKSARRWMRRDAQVIFEGHEQLIDCVVHDISDGGARLSFTAPLAVLPRTFTLVLFKDSVQRDCELVWSDRRAAGVKFISQWFGTNSSERVSALKKRRGPREPKSIA